MNVNKTKNQTQQLKRWPLCCLLFFFFACNDTTINYNKLVITPQDSIADAQLAARAFTQIDSIQKTIHSGDLITRTGNDFTSESLRQLNQKDKTYSHCGIASIENDSVFVYHALGGEFNPDQKIRRDPLKIFSEPYSNRGIGIFRFQLMPAEIDGVITLTKKEYAMGLMFDMKFDLTTDDRVYCAEFVYKTYTKGTNNKLQFNISHIKDFNFIGVDDLFIHQMCKEQARILYK
jgi:hypothetical protein